MRRQRLPLSFARLGEQEENRSSRLIRKGFAQRMRRVYREPVF